MHGVGAAGRYALQLVALAVLIALIALPPDAGAITRDALDALPKRSPICTIEGTARADLLEGTSREDVICGGGGADRIRGAAGNDTIFGGQGGDRLRGQEGDDLLDGGRGHDQLTGGGGEDACVTSPGIDRRNGSCPRPNDLYPPGYPPSGQPAPGHCWGESAPPSDWCVPDIHSFTIAPDVVDTSSADAEIDWSMQLSDDVSGVQWVVVFAPTPDGNSASGMLVREPAAGTRHSGTWTGTISLPNGYARGRHPIGVMAVDEANNYFDLQPEHLAFLGFQSSFEQVGQADAALPALTGLEIAPTSVDATADDRTVALRVAATDDFAGVEGVYLHVSGPDGEIYWSQRGNTAELESGTATNGVWRNDFVLRKGAPAGTYEIETVGISDGLRSASYSTEELRDMGLPTTFKQAGEADRRGT